MTVKQDYHTGNDVFSTRICDDKLTTIESELSGPTMDSLLVIEYYRRLFPLTIKGPDASNPSSKYDRGLIYTANPSYNI